MKSKHVYLSHYRFLDFILPKTKKRFSQGFVKKVSKRQQRKSSLAGGDAPEDNDNSHAKLMMKKFDVSYDAICSLTRLFEKEVELFRMISKFIRRVIFGLQKKHGQAELLQISDIYSAMDF